MSEQKDDTRNSGEMRCSTFAFAEEHVNYVSQYGGRCRDCADENGFCPGSGLPCINQKMAIKYVLDAIEYGVRNGFVVNPNT